MKKLGRTIATAVAATLAVGGLTFAAAPAQAVGGFHQVEPDSPCTDVLVLGARGSGQSAEDAFGVGPEVYLGIGAYANQLPGYDIGFDEVVFSAQDVKTLALMNNGKWDGKTFLDGMYEGVTNAVKYIRNRAGMCQDEHYVLAGFSQGAMVMHRTFTELAGLGSRLTEPSLALPRIDGVLAIADGDRYPGEGSRRYGTASASTNGVSWIVKNSTKYPMRKVIPSIDDWLPSERFHSVCQEGDIVCDFNSVTTANNYLAAGDLHGTTYKPGAAGSQPVLAAAAEIAKTTKMLIPKAPQECTDTVPCDPTWVAIMTFGKTLTTERGSTAEWIIEIPGAELTSHFFGVELSFTAPVSGRYPWSVRLTHADGTTEDVAGVIVAYDVPPQSLHIPTYSQTYVSNGGTPYTLLTVEITKVTASNTTTNQIAAYNGSNGVEAFYVVSGDTDNDGFLDLGETWVERAQIPWTSAEPANTRNINLIVWANDPTLVPGYQFEEMSLIIPVTRIVGPLG